MKIISYFKHNNVPQEGLFPKIKIRKISDKSIVVDDESMVEIGDGFYSYDFENYEEGIQFTVLVNGGNELSPEEKYSHGVIDSIDHTDAISFIKNIEGGRWQIKDNQMVFFKDDNKTEVAKFNLYNQSGQKTSTDVMERRRVFAPTSGNQKIIRTSKFVGSNVIGISQGTYRLNVSIDSTMFNLNIIYNGETFNNIISFINSAIGTKGSCSILNGEIVISSLSTGINSIIRIDNTSSFLVAMNAIEPIFVMTPTDGYGDEGPN